MTIKDIAKESGYAVSTVSRVLNGHPDVSEEARTRVMAVVERYGFQPNSNAKHLKQRSSSGIAIIVKGTQNMLFASIVERIQVLIRDSGYAAFVYYIDEDENELDQALRVSRERRPFGILFLGSNVDFFREKFPAISVPCVLVTNSAANLKFPNLSSVSTDDSQAAMEAVESLIALGHRNIGVLGGPMCASDASNARFQGCLRALERHGLPFDRARQYGAARFNLSEGYAAMVRLLDQAPELTAVFAMSDVQAVGALRALHDRGLGVPEDMSVLGFDGIPLGGYCVPRLSTIRQDADRIARRSVELLLERIDKVLPAEHETVSFQLLPGESVGPPRHEKS